MENTSAIIKSLCDEFARYNKIEESLYSKYRIKRGLRNSDGTGVLAGITNICNVHGYIMNEGEKEPIEGKLSYRGIEINDIINGCAKDNRYSFEETVYLLLFGRLPNKTEFDEFTSLLAKKRELPESFIDDMIIKAPSANVMNKMGRAILALYSYDDTAEDCSIKAELLRSVNLIARLPRVIVSAYQVKRRHYDGESMIFHPLREEETTAQSILSTLRDDRQYTEDEARLLDLCLTLHAEHGGGNNSTFSCCVLTSSGTDAYSAYAAAVGSLKGMRHGGANIKVIQMLDKMKQDVEDITDENQVYDYICKLIRREAGDKSGLVYGMGHAVYTKSDPRAVVLKDRAMKLAKGTEFEADFNLLNMIEEFTPRAFAQEKNNDKVICANVDLYSGMVYRMLNIPDDLFTPLFAASRMAGWCAHRLEELANGKRIIRPAYKAIAKAQKYIPINER